MAQDDDPALAETQSPALAARPDPDTRARDVARARVANALFATNHQVTLGRYHLLERVGQGGMGVVWGAYDPELERRVAIKLVRAKEGALRERILLEGQALAKLSHPNVVAVHDVGVVDDEIYIVMEWVRGRNLREYASAPHTVREIVTLYRAACEGLLAAHRAGLVHRDFKPENVMIGDDERVRVVDFGLALALDDDIEHAVAGTPKYMAPEQQRGGQVTPAVDQYAFGVALHEALAARNADRRDAAVPSWLTAIVTRATAVDPDNRFASLDELLRALARDPATIWRRRIVVGGALGVAAAAFVVGSLRASDGPEPCAGSRGELATIWNAAASARVVTHGKELGPYGLAEAQQIAGGLGDYSERWVASHRGACLAHRRGEITTRLYERGLSCLGRARAALATVVDVLGHSTVETYPDAVLAARSLPDVERCMTDAVTSVVEPPAREVAGLVAALDADATRARYLALASDPQAVAVARGVAAAAARLGYAPLVARAQLALGASLAIYDSELGAAVVAFASAATSALAASDDVVFVEAYAREVFYAGRMPSDKLPSEARDFAGAFPLVEVIARRAGRAASFPRGLFYNNVGTTRMAAGDPAGAERWYRKARDELRGGASGVELWMALGNLAMVVESRSERDELFAEEHAGLEQALGPTHALTLLSRYRAAGFVDNAETAARSLAAVCTAYATWYPHISDRIAKCNYELGMVADERGERDVARRAYESVAASKFGQEAIVARAYLAGSVAAAEQAEQQLHADAGPSAAWFMRFPALVDVKLVIARANAAEGRVDAAIAALRAALDVIADPRINHKATRVQRRLARVRAELALLLARRNPTEAAGLARASLEWSTAAGGYADRVRSLEPITAAARY